METNNIQIVPIEQEEEQSSFDFVHFVKRCLKNWGWFALSVILCLSLASLYILRTRPMYTRTATVLIKESAARRMAASDIESVLNFSGGSTMSSKVVNEVIVFQSPALMQEVVKRLGLTTDYFSIGLLRDNAIYGMQVPVSVEFINLPEKRQMSFTLTPLGDSEYKISKFSYVENGQKIEMQPLQAHLGDTLYTAACGMLIRPNEFFPTPWEHPVTVRHYSLDAATSMYCSRFSAAPEDMQNNGDVLNLQIQDYSVQRADDILNTLLSVYNESWVEDKNRMAVSTSEFIADRLVALEKELGDVDDDISSFKSQNLLPDLEAMSDLYLTQTKENTKMQQELSNQLNTFRYIKNYLAAHPGNENLIPAISGLGSGNASGQIEQYNKTLLSRNNIRSNSSEDNPLVQDLNAALVATRAAIETSIDNQIGTISAQLKELGGIEMRNNSRIAQSPTQAKYLMSVGRQQKVKEALYLYLLQKREENELSQAFSAYNTRLITPPMGLAKPSSPRKMRIMLMALFLGLFIPFVTFYIIEATDTKVSSRHDLKGLSLPYLGEIPLNKSSRSKGVPLVHGKNEPAKTIVVNNGNRNMINEAFRIVRTNLEFMEKGNDCPVVMVCSYNSGSGKTFFTANLAATMALKNHKVLIMDCDMRRAKMSEYVASPKLGLSDYLAGDQTDIHSLICKVSGRDNIEILPVGTLPPNPSELIGQPEFPALVAKLKKEYDYVFIDCPPIDIVADTRIIGECADRTVFIIRSGLFDKKDVSSLEKLYVDRQFSNLCYVFNGVEVNSSYYGKYGKYNRKTGGYYGN